MRALITGVTGFVGGHLARWLLNQGDEVLGCSNTGAWLPDSPRELAARVPLVTWDVADPRDPPAAIEHFAPQVIYHLAALGHPAECGQHAPTAAALAVNVGGTRAVVALARRLSSRPRLLLVSSSHVYAPVTADTGPIDESWPVSPRNGYGQTKLLAEQVALEAAVAGSDIVIARSFQHAGPGQAGPLMLAEWARQFASGEDPIRVQNRDTIIDLTDVRDVVRGYRLLAATGERGGIYNLGSGVPRRSGDVLELLRQAAGSDRTIIELQPGMRHDPLADCSRLTRLTGWRPAVPIERTVADTYAWWLARGAPTDTSSRESGS
jgi:GDP-4-dehydro-6-deoxy-D-mannose reductase